MKIPCKYGEYGRIVCKWRTQSEREKIVYLICKINFRIEIYELYLLNDGKISQQYLPFQQLWGKINVVRRDLINM